MSSFGPGGRLGRWVKAALVASLVLAGVQAYAQTGIRGTKHNLSTGNAIAGANKVTGTTPATGTAEVCVFCHTPHQANTAVSAPLWNKALPGTTYQTYQQSNSATLDGEVLAVGSVSLACLSCHDGTQAMDNIINAPGSGGLTNGGGATGLGYTWAGTRVDADGKLTGVAALGANLVDDHPIGIQYCGGGPNDAAPAAACRDSDFVAPSSGLVNGTRVFWVDTSQAGTRQKTDMILYNRTFTNAGIPGGVAGSGPSVECASCHDPHVNEGDTSNSIAAGATFLRISNAGSAVCLACHVK